jgi:alpha-2-macroglobulin
VKAGQGANLSFSMTAPRRLGQAAFRVIAKTGDFSDGELRVLPLLPSRMRLVQSKFATLRDKDSRVLQFEDLAKSDDPTRNNEQLVVTVDAQLFFTVLQALPYLTRYPYECTEQTLNRFVSTGIVSSVFRDHPAVAKMAAKFSKRDTPLETFDGLDPNRKIALEEAPWLQAAKGGKSDGDASIDVLDPKVAAAERASALAKLKKAQLPNGAWPWFPGGPPSPYMTLYLLHGFAKAAEFKVELPRDVVQHAWAYLASEFRGETRRCMANEGCWEWVTFLSYVASAFPDESWLGGAFTAAERQQMLEFSFKHWKKHSPYLKGYLALTLKRMKRDSDAKLVFDSVMDSAKTTRDEGTFWMPEDRSWLWYNDSIETHAFALRTLTELQPKDPRRDGLVQWLLVNKKLNQWKSTRATAEVIYALVKHMEADKSLGVREETLVEVGPVKKQWVFKPDEYTGKKNQLVISGPEVTPAMSQVKVSKSTRGFQFASATWHFSTDQLPREGKGDLFSVSRTFFKRERGAKDVSLKPLADGAKLEVGDELEVQLSIRSRAPAEYVHVKDPRGAGFEPEGAVSRYKWNSGVGWYEEYRDSSTNFFFEALPAGELSFKYRVRAAVAGTFRVGPAVMQSMYAPEFTAYSAGHVMPVAASGQ